MAKITDERYLILHCNQVNLDYMRLPAGQLRRYQNIKNIYDRLAKQSLACATAWVNGQECPDHEAAVDAFWWATVSWAEAFGQAIGADAADWDQVFVTPHVSFATYLRPIFSKPQLDNVSGSCVEIIMGLDVTWIKALMKMTAAWAWLFYLKDMGAFSEGKQLESESNCDSEVRVAYIKSDLEFFDRLFAPFNLSVENRNYLKQFLNKAKDEVNGSPNYQPDFHRCT